LQRINQEIHQLDSRQIQSQQDRRAGAQEGGGAEHGKYPEHCAQSYAQRNFLRRDPLTKQIDDGNYDFSMQPADPSSIARFFVEFLPVTLIMEWTMNLQVECYSGQKADERPVRFRLDDRDFMVEELLDQWYGPDDVFFKVRADDGNLYILRHKSSANQDAWMLEGFREIRS